MTFQCMLYVYNEMNKDDQEEDEKTGEQKIRGRRRKILGLLWTASFRPPHSRRIGLWAMHALGQADCRVTDQAAYQVTIRWDDHLGV